MPWKDAGSPNDRRVIQQGDSGIWGTCNKGKESQCIGELRDLFSDYAETLYGDVVTKETSDSATASTDVAPPAGIEDDIQDEVAELKRPNSIQLFTPIRIDVQCGEFTCYKQWPELMRQQWSSSRQSTLLSLSDLSRRSAKMQ